MGCRRSHSFTESTLSTPNYLVLFCTKCGETQEYALHKPRDTETEEIVQQDPLIEFKEIDLYSNAAKTALDDLILSEHGRKC